jgi:RNA polymerase sigma-70 factor (ECF subfamily)
MAVREQRRNRLRSVLERTELEPTSDQPIDFDLAAAMKELSPTQRAIVVLYYYEDRPTAEIVDILGMSQSTVRVHLSRARRHLAELLREEVGDDVG